MKASARRADAAIRRIARVLFIGFLALPFLAVTSATAASATIDADSINKSVVWVDAAWATEVDVSFTDGSLQTYKTNVISYCTGWFVSNTGHVATAGHCVETDNDSVRSAYAKVIAENGLTGITAQEADWPVRFEEDPLIRIGQPLGIEDGILSGESAITAQLIGKQSFQNGDNAVLRIAGLENTPALPVSATKPEVGEEVTTIGFAGLTADTSDVSRQMPSYREGAVSSHSFSDRGVPNIEIDVDVIPGMSGGPTINENGEVVGINSSLVAGGSNQVNYITDTQTLRDFLTTNGVTLGGAPAPAPTSSAIPVPAPASPAAPAANDAGQASGIPGWMVGLIIGLAVILLALVAYIVIERRKRQQPAVAPVQNTNSNDQAPPTV